METMTFAGNKKGALPSQIIRRMFESGYIKNITEDQIKPSSLDLTLSNEVYEVEGIFQPRPNETVREVLSKIKRKKFSFDKVLKKNQMYLIRLNEEIRLPENVYGYCNPKSSSGRVDIHVRLIADRVSRYDSLTPGWQGEVWVSIMPKSFSVIVAPGQSYNQIRFFNSDTRLSDIELELAMHKDKLLWHFIDQKTPYEYSHIKIRDNDGSIIQRLDLESSDIVGYVGKKVSKVIDLSKINFYKSADFFEPIHRNGEFIYLKKDYFYILSTTEAVRVPPHYACEMVPMDERSGEFRSHYAGFIDPGWGWGKDGEGKGRPLTLEVRPFEDIVVRNKQPIAKIKFEHMSEVPDLVYDAMDSNYKVQTGPRLSKNFKSK